MMVCVRSDSELKEFEPSQYLDDYSWDIFIPISRWSILLVLMLIEVMMIILVCAMEPTTLKRNLMEYDSHGHAGFLERIFRADLIRNKAGMPTANT